MGENALAGGEYIFAREEAEDGVRIAGLRVGVSSARAYPNAQTLPISQPSIYEQNSETLNPQP